MSTFTDTSEHVFAFDTLQLHVARTRSRDRRPRGAHLQDDQLRVPRFPACCRPLRSGRRRQHLRTPDQLHPGGAGGARRGARGRCGRARRGFGRCGHHADHPGPCPSRRPRGRAEDHLRRYVQPARAYACGFRRRDDLRRYPRSCRGRGRYPPGDDARLPRDPGQSELGYPRYRRRRRARARTPCLWWWTTPSARRISSGLSSTGRTSWCTRPRSSSAGTARAWAASSWTAEPSTGRRAASSPR